MNEGVVRILLVEDNAGDTRLLRELLSDTGAGRFDLVHVERLQDAVHRLDAGVFHVVLLDLTLPDSQGLDTLRRLYSHAPGVAIIVLTAVEDENQALRAVQEGAQDYLCKSQLDAGLLARSMRYAIERHRMLSELELARRLEHYLATHDILTNLPNRQLFQDRLGQSLGDARRRERKVAVLFLDLDRFKLLNDTFGHTAGDRLLVQVAERLTGCIRETDTAARLGGDEFTVILTAIRTVQEAAKLAEKILNALARPFVLDGQQLFLTASLGISLYPCDGLDTDALLKNADIAMYRAKAKGRNTYQFYLPEMNARALERLDLERSLRLAVDREELRLQYQPQTDAVTGRVVGLEALVRWQHPSLGLLSPGHFIPLAEETGLIVPVGEWVLRAACAQNKAWQDAGLPPMSVAVNFSARQFQHQNPAVAVRQALEDTGLNPRYLELELTESVVMSDADTASSTLRELTGLGIQISIDDFGTGYSSLSYLKQFPLEKLKIAEIFVRSLTADENDRAITSAIVAMAHSLQLKAVAEGVETPEQLEILRSLKCDSIQGYLTGRPQDPERITELLARQIGSARALVMLS